MLNKTRRIHITFIVRWLALTVGLPLSLYFSSTWLPHNTAAQKSVDEAQSSVQPVVNLSRSAEMPTEYTTTSRTQRVLAAPGGVQALSLASADFDEDGTLDLVSGYGRGAGGILTTHRGNVDFSFPNGPEAQLRRARGEFVEAPFFPKARAFDIPAAPDFIGAGDFD